MTVRITARSTFQSPHLCRVCGGADVAVDEVDAQGSIGGMESRARTGLLQLCECRRCSHLWTCAIPERVAQVVRVQPRVSEPQDSRNRNAA